MVVIHAMRMLINKGRGLNKMTPQITIDWIQQMKFFPESSFCCTYQNLKFMWKRCRLDINVIKFNCCLALSTSRGITRVAGTLGAPIALTRIFTTPKNQHL